MTELLLLSLLIIINGTPILVRWVLHDHWSKPIDFGLKGFNGRPLLGRSKTWRGLIFAIITSVLVSHWFGFGLYFGLFFGSIVMLSDMAASYIKRRMGLDPSDQAIGLDQIPESLIPLIYANLVLDFGWSHVFLLSAAFMVLELIISKPLYWLKIRRRPY